MSRSYWHTSMECILDGAGITVSVTQLQEIVDGVLSAIEMEGEATGRYCIPNPLQADVDRLKRDVKTAQEETEQKHRDFVKNVCTRHHCDPSQVTIEGSDAIIYR